MNSYKLIKVENERGIVTVRMAREEARNALNPALMQELTEIAGDLRSDPDIRVVILRGADTYFSAGADLKARSGSGDKQTLLELRQTMLAGPDMCKAWENIEAITIAAIEGYCIGGAAALALSCDFRMIGKSGMMRLPEVPLGINMSWQSLPRITTIAGPARAKRFTIFGEATQADTLLDWSMVDEIVEDGDAYNEAMKWAEKLLLLPPIPVRMSKEAINATANANHHATTFMDRDQYLLTFMTEDFKEGVRAFFEKRDPKFKGN